MQKNKKFLAVATVIIFLIAVAVAVMVANSGLLATHQNVNSTPTPKPQTPTTEPTTQPTPTPTKTPIHHSSSSSSSSSSLSSSSNPTPSPTPPTTATPTPTPTETTTTTPTPTPEPTATPIPSPSTIPTPDPTQYEVFRDNFATGDMSAWNGTTISDVQLSVENNLLKCQTNYATNQSWGYLYKVLGSNYSSLNWRWYVFFDNLPINEGGFIGVGGIYNHDIEQNFNAANSVCSLGVVTQSGQNVWKFTYGNNGILYHLTTTQIVQAGTWYLVELQAIEGNGTGEVHFYLNSIQTLSATGLVNNNNAGIDHISIGGGITADQAVTWYCGGVVASTQYIGPSPSPAMKATIAPVPIMGILAIGTVSTLFLTSYQIVRKLKR